MTLGRTKRIGLDERVTALEEALAGCEGRIPDEVLAPASAALQRAAERRALGDQLVVVALAGGTGTGKSSLFNALAGDDLAAVDVVRPTTSEPTAWVVADEQEAGPLLDWLEVPTARRFHAAAASEPDGLVLLDLPDIDSVEAANHVIAGRLIERVDVLLWVVDPHKYAQASLHDGYLARLAEHAEVMHLVLNQVDRLDPSEVSTCVDDLRRLVDGRRGPRILTTSARTGAGVDQLAAAVVEDVTERRAVAARIAADVRTAAADLSRALMPPERDGDGGRRDRRADLLDEAALTTDLAALSGVDGVGDQARHVYLGAARFSSRSALLRLLAFLAGTVRAVAGLGRATGRLLGTATPGAAARPRTAVTSTEVEHVLADLAARARDRLPWSWATRIHELTGQIGTELPAALHAAVAPVRRRPAGRRWWSAVALIGTGAELIAAVGAGWLLAANLTAQTTVPTVPVVMVGEDVSLAGLLVGIGLASWSLLLVVRAVAVRVGARRHQRATTRAAHAAVDDAVEATAIAPLRDELATYAGVWDALARAAA